MKVTVIIPCCNVEAFIGNCLQSVLQQTYSALQIICVDDASTDGTVANIHRMQQDHPSRIELLQHAERKGANAARNSGLKASNGTYLQFLDADDTLRPEKIAKQMKIAQEHDLPSLIIGDYENQYPNGRKEIVRAEYDRPWLALAKGKCGTTSGNLWQREALIAAGNWDEDLKSSQDHELIYRILKLGGRVVFDRTVGTEIFKRAEGSISRTNITDNWIRYVHLRHKIRGYLAAMRPSEKEAIDVLDRNIFGALTIVAKQERELAIEEFQRIFPKGYIPHRPWHAHWMNRLFGFGTTTRLRSLIGL